ncbi:branched-chain amino acid ABC transporter permease [Chloroflexota bacterium]
MDFLYQIIEIVISGLANGSVYAVMSVGLTLVYGVARVFNWAYGSFYTWAAYFAFYLFSLFAGMNYFLVILGVALFMFIFGLLAERVAVRPLLARPDWQITTMLTTLGLALFLDNSVVAIFGPRTKTLPHLFEGHVSLGPLIISMRDIGVFLIAISVLVALELFLTKTRQGMVIRATSQDTMGAQIVGIPVKRIFSLTFAISAVLAGISSILLVTKYFMSPLGGWDILIKAFIIVAFGGLGSVRGTLYAAFILGLVEAFVGWMVGFQWVMVIWFAVLISILVIRPQGLSGKWA